MPGHVSNYSITTTPLTSAGGGGKAPDKSVLYWDAVNNLIKGSADFVFNDTLKQLTLGTGSQLLLPNGTAAAPSLAFASDPTMGWLKSDAATWGFGKTVYAPGVALWYYGAVGVVSGGTFGFSSSATSALQTQDVTLSRPSAGVLSLSTGAQFRFPNGTSAVPALSFNTDPASGFNMLAQNYIDVVVGGVPQFQFTPGVLYPYTDATKDLGNASYRWRSISTGGVANIVPITAKAHASQTAALMEIQNSSGVAYMAVQADHQTYIYATGIAKTPLRLYAASGQTASLQTWLDVSAGVLSKVGPDGAFYSGGKAAGGITGTPQVVASALYVQSRGQNLLTNGSLLLANNYNFSAWTFDPVETHGGGGSIKISSTGPSSNFIDEFLTVDATKTYVLSGWCKNGNADGSEDQATATQYYMVAPFDADQIAMTPIQYSKYPGSTDTTLAVELKAGDITMTLTDATGWNNVGGSDYWNRLIIWWPYTNAKGYSYPNYTYTRNSAIGAGVGYTTNGMWAGGGISGNVVTLTSAWTGVTLPAGTPVRNSTSGGTYKYIALAGVHVPSAWTHYWGTIGGVDNYGAQIQSRFPAGTAYVKVGWLTNYPSTHAGTNTVRWSDMRFQESSSWLSGGDNGNGTTITPLTNANPGVVDVRGGTTPQVFRIWNTLNEAAGSGDYAYVGWVGNGLYLSSNKAGAGTARSVYVDSASDLYLRSFGTATYLYVNGQYRAYCATAAFNPYADTAMYLGDSTHRWRQGWFGGVAAEVPLNVKAHASQTANLQEWQNSSGTALSRVKANGRWRHDGATTFDDLRIEPVARSTGAKAPAFETWFTNGAGSVGVNLYSFDDAAAASEKEIFFTMQMPHNWKEGTAIQLHVHWIGNVNDTTSQPRWGLEYTWSDIGQVFGNSAIVYDTQGNIDGSGSSDANITAFKHYINHFAAITPSATQNNISSILIGRIFRNSSDALDTYDAATNKCGLLYIDAHYEVDSFGSDTIYAKD